MKNRSYNRETDPSHFENGVFRPFERVDLPERSEVEFEPRLIHRNGDQTEPQQGVYDVLSERYDSGESDVAARHDEHQP